MWGNLENCFHIMLFTCPSYLDDAVLAMVKTEDVELLPRESREARGATRSASSSLRAAPFAHRSRVSLSPGAGLYWGRSWG